MTNDKSRSECGAQLTQQGPRQKLQPPLVLPKFPNLEVFSQGESHPLCRQPETHALIRFLPGVPMSKCAQRHGHYLPMTLGTKPLCRGQDSGRKPHALTTLNLRYKTCPRKSRERQTQREAGAGGQVCDPQQTRGHGAWRRFVSRSTCGNGLRDSPVQGLDWSRPPLALCTPVPPSMDSGLPRSAVCDFCVCRPVCPLP